MTPTARDLVLTQPHSGVSVISRGGSGITVEGGFDDVLMLLSRIRDDGRMVPFAGAPVAIPGGGVRVYVRLSPAAIEGEVISPLAAVQGRPSRRGPRLLWRSVTRFSVVPVGAVIAGVAVLALAQAARWGIGIAGSHPVLAFTFALALMVAAAVGVAARSDSGIGCVDSGGPKSAVDADADDSGNPVQRSPLRRRRAPARRPRWAVPVRQRIRYPRSAPVQGTAPVPSAPEAPESAPVDVEENPPPLVRVPVFRRLRWVAAPVPVSTRMARPSPQSPAGECEPPSVPVEVEVEPEPGRRRFRSPADRPRWFPMGAAAPANENSPTSMCTASPEIGKGRSHWAPAAPVAMLAPEPEPVDAQDEELEPDRRRSPVPHERPRWFPTRTATLAGADHSPASMCTAGPDAGTSKSRWVTSPATAPGPKPESFDQETVPDLAEPSRPVHQRMRFWPQREIPAPSETRSFTQVQPHPVVALEVDEDPDLAPIPRRIPGRWWAHSPAADPEPRRAYSPAPVETVKPSVIPEADEPGDDQDLVPSSRHSPRPVPRLRATRQPAAPVALPGLDAGTPSRSTSDPHTTAWVSALRDSAHAQADDAYVSSDDDCRCALGWGFDRRRSSASNLRSMRAQYGRRFCNDIEQKNGSGRWSLPDLADYIERKRG